MIKKNIKIFSFILLLLYITFLFNAYIFYKNECKQREDFISMLELISNTVGGKYDKKRKVMINNSDIKNTNLSIKEVKYIYIKKNNNEKSNNEKYNLYNKNNEKYAFVNIDISNNILSIFDINDDKIGQLKKQYYNDYYVECDIFPNKKIIVQFMNYYKDVKINIEGDDKYFYIKSFNEYEENDSYNSSNNTDSLSNTISNTISKTFSTTKYTIYLYALKIGKIKENNDSTVNKIIVYDEYKKYLNIFGVVYTMLDNIT